MKTKILILTLSLIMTLSFPILAFELGGNQEGFLKTLNSNPINNNKGISPAWKNNSAISHGDPGLINKTQGFKSHNYFGNSHKPGVSWTGDPGESHGYGGPIGNTYKNNQGMNPQIYQESIGWGHSQGEGYSQNAKPLGSNASSNYWPDKSKVSNFSW